jgi:hypothetical protein
MGPWGGDEGSKVDELNDFSLAPLGGSEEDDDVLVNIRRFFLTPAALTSVRAVHLLSAFTRPSPLPSHSLPASQ